MKIRNDQLRALQESEGQRTQTKKTAEGFDNLLSRELTANPAHTQPGAATSSSPPNLTGPLSIRNPALLELQASLAPGALQSAGLGVAQEAMGEMENMLDSLETYAKQLALDEKADLRGAYALLESVSGTIHGLKERYPGVGDEHPDLAALVDELDALSITETYKFNRGDYL